LIVVHLVGRHDGRTFDDRDVSFVLGEGLEVGVVDGVEQGLKKMKKGELARLFVKSKYAYRAEGLVQHNLPPNADLEYDVELKKFEKVIFLTVHMKLAALILVYCLKL